ncbi:unnamed protein product [Cunninghamella blakesleeana]
MPIRTIRPFISRLSLKRSYSSSSCSSSLTQPLRPNEPIGYINIRKPLPYQLGLELQNLLVQRRLKLSVELKENPNGNMNTNIPLDIVCFLQHTPTYTAGRRIRGQEYEGKRLNELGADYVETMRGGQVTFHGPGQLVAYPIVDIRDYRLSVRCYVSRLEKIIIDTCNELGIKANTTENTGVWVGQDHKIAALGVHIQKYITSHGLALNCNTDLSWYNHIIPCGLGDKKVTSLSQQLNTDFTVEKSLPLLIQSFEKLFSKPLKSIQVQQVNDLLKDYL